MSQRYTNTVIAAAYSLSIDKEVLQQCLEQMRKATEVVNDKQFVDGKMSYTFIVNIEEKNLNGK